MKNNKTVLIEGPNNAPIPAPVRRRNQYGNIFGEMNKMFNKSIIMAILLAFAANLQMRAEVDGVATSTTGYITKWDDATLKYINNSLIYDNGTNLGIGTTTPLSFAVMDIERTASISTGALMGLEVNLLNTYSGGLPGIGDATGIQSICETSEDGSLVYALQGEAFNTSNANCTVAGVRAYSQGGGSNGNTFGIDAEAVNCGTNNFVYAGYFHVNSCGSGNTFYAGYFGGDVYTTGSYMPSDQILKNNVLPLTGTMANLMKLQPKTYLYKTKDFPSMNLPEGNQMGLIAEDVESLYPSLVKKVRQPEIRDKKGNITDKAVDFKAINYTGLIPIIISGVQEQQAMILKQQNQIAQLENKMTTLEDKYNNLLADVEQLKADRNSDQGMNTLQPSLEQNNPNPFTQNTIIRYYLPDNMPNATIIVKTMDGKTVQTYTVTTHGNGQVTINGGTLAQGTYIYEMTANGNMIDSKKMIIVAQ